MKSFTNTAFLFLLLLTPIFSLHAQEIVPDTHEYIKATVLTTEFKENRHIFGSTTQDVYSVTAKLDDGSIQTFENDHFIVKVGSRIYVHKRTDIDGSVFYSMDEPIRFPVLMILVILFILLSIWIGGKQGVKGLISLIVSILLIFLILLPSITRGYSPVFVSICVASIIIILGSFVTHGFNRTTGSAVLGMIGTVIGLGLFALLVIRLMSLTGVYGEEVVYLIFNTQGTVDAKGLLFAGIMIGLLGILYDVAIGQAIAIEELLRADPTMTKTRLITRGIRIGREHIGALINTLAIAYVGASLPLLLLFSTSDSGIMYILNREDISTEIVRILIGSMSIIVAVPVTTYIAVHILKKYGIPHHHTKGGCAHTH